MTPEERIKETLLAHLENPEEYEIFLFGSRAKGNHRKNSDYDIAIKGKTKIDFLKLLRIKNILNELPYLIDVVDFHDVDDTFKEIAFKHTKKWN